MACPNSGNCSTTDTEDGGTLVNLFIVIAVVIVVIIVIILGIIATIVAVGRCFRAPVPPNTSYSKPSDSTAVPSMPGTLLLPRHHQTKRTLRSLYENSVDGGPDTRHELTPKQRLLAFDFPHSKVCLISELRETTFGKVYKGEASGLIESDISSTVLVKSLKEVASKDLLQAFNQEMVWVSGFMHPNILQLLAVSISEHPHYMIFEYLEYGTLINFLQSMASVWIDMDLESVYDTGTTRSKSSNKQLVGLEELLSISIQIADAMEYMTNKGFVHKDVAARNCQVGDGLHVKIADFGYSRDIKSPDYVCLMRDSEPVPLRWMAPEILNDQQHTVYSDVWAFGVLLWEIFSFGQLPYTSLTDEQVMEHVLAGQNLPQTEYCPIKVHKVMQECWLMPENRLGFKDIGKKLRKCVQSFDMGSVSRRFSLLTSGSTPLLH